MNNQALLDTLWADLQLVQAAADSYFELPCSHFTIPSNGASTTTDRISTVTGQTWADINLPVTFPFAVECFHVHGPLGSGYYLIARTKINGETWLWQKSYGPYDNNKDWAIEEKLYES